ncbi:lamin tail domain-containing protein [Paraflavisolibacter sp. H34]|uniref:lamin tail domain-containing protein n=1 Tax=Huijunlia imazamoxiresistens TaxID=3127457 RepID=UPI00301A2A84
MTFPRFLLPVVFLLPFLARGQQGALQRFELVIDEIMADPAPAVGLPAAEYVELKNTSGRELNLKGCRLATATALSGPFPELLLPAGSYLILASTANAPAFAALGSALGVGSFPALDNNGTVLSLLSPEGRSLHSVEYTSAWYANVVKQEGGWSLEMVDTRYPCTGSANWKPSTDNSGGTPGRTNSVEAANPDETGPVLQAAVTPDSLTLVLTFSEPVDSSSAAASSLYQLTPGITVRAAMVLAPGFTQVQLELFTPLAPSAVYTLRASGIGDCAGNKAESSLAVGLPQEPSAGDVVINELLFNPKPGASDYVELYNRGSKIVDAAGLYVAGRSGGALSAPKRLSEKPFYLFPGAYLVLTEDGEALQRGYRVKAPGQVLSLPSLPALPDDRGAVALLNRQGAVVDEVAYTRDWHFGLIDDAEGVALERMDPDGPSQDKSNWHSAASTAGYGTPTYRNSQYRQAGALRASIDISPKIFSPDNDGHEDVLLIRYSLSESGYVANLVLFDAGGRLVRRLVKNDLLGLSGSWTWDGLDEKGQQLPVGTYIILTELFNLQGRKEHFKQTVVLARRLN